MAKAVLQPPHHTAAAAAPISPQYDAPARPVGSIPEPPVVHQWPATQSEHAVYLAQNQPGNIMPAGASNPSQVPDGHHGMHDPAMIQAAQLLIPGDYQAAREYSNYHGMLLLTFTSSIALFARRPQSFSGIHYILRLHRFAGRVVT